MLCINMKRKHYFLIFSLCVVIFVLLYEIKVNGLHNNYALYFKNFQNREFQNFTDINCDLILNGDPLEQNRSLMQGRQKGVLTDAHYANISNCTTFIEERQYLLNATEEEMDFPLAFTIVTHKDLFQLERLLRAVYRPHNVYCLHIDLKVSSEMYRGAEMIVDCFPNVYLASQRFNVSWGRFSLLEADFQCIKDVEKSGRPFKYLINLTGQDFPLKTNLELVRILKAFNGGNEIQAIVKQEEIPKERIPHEKPTFPMRYAKGSIHITATRGYIDYIVNSPRAKEVYEILRRHDACGLTIPDETFYPTLNINPDSMPAPGASLKDPHLDPNIIFLSRVKLWLPLIAPNETWLCPSRKFVHDICILGVRDLPHLIHLPHFFANKFYWDFEPDALTCLESHIRERTRQNMVTGEVTDLDLEVYKNRDFVKHHIPSNPML